MNRWNLTLSSRFSATVVASCAITLLLFPYSVSAKDPYKSKDIPTEIARDIKIEPQRVLSFKRSFCAVISKGTIRIGRR